MKDFKKLYSFGPKRPAYGSDSKEPHKTTCDGCHTPCEVPFKPNGKKPVYCRNCYKGKETTTSFSGQPFSRPTEYKDDGSTDLKKQFTILNTKLDRLISAIEAQTRVLSDKE